MYFVIFITDKPGAEQTRIDMMDTIRTYLHDHPDHPGVSLHHAGPTLAENGETINGSLLLVEAPSLEVVRAFVADHPLNKAGRLAECQVRQWDWRTGCPT